MFRNAIARHARLFSTSTRLRKGPIETGKDALKGVDRTVSDMAVKGIETGEQVAQSVKETVGYSSSKAEGKASGAVDHMSGKASEMSGKASEVAGEAKGKAHEIAGQAKGKAEEVKAKM